MTGPRSPAQLTLGTAMSDVVATRERVRQTRLRRLTALLVLIVSVLVLRDLLSKGRPFALPHLPPSLIPYLPGLCLIVVLVLVLVVPLYGAGRSPHVLYRPNEIDVRFDDVRGAGMVREEVLRTLEIFLAHQRFADQMGGSPRRGILFEGPPGTGKTYMAKAMAAEAGVPFLFVSASAFQSMYYGQTNRKVRSFFRALRKYAREEGGAIGFIEEIDAIGGARSGLGIRGEGVSGVVNELLVQLQSFDEPATGARLIGLLIDRLNRWLPDQRRRSKPVAPKANILVIGATNRADDLDPALVRPGRFDRRIYFDLPNRTGRRDIIDHYLDKKAHDVTLDDDGARDALAALTMGYSPAMIEHLLNEALVSALRRSADRLSWEDIQQAKMTEEIGLGQPVEYPEAERRLIATHEAGHAAVAYLVGKGRKLEVLSIIKRRDALGLLVHSEIEERFTKTRSELEALIQIAFGGLVAEQLLFGETSSGVAADLKAATDAACQMIGSLAMGTTLISARALETTSSANLAEKVLSNDAGREEVEALLRNARDQVTTMLSQNLPIVEALRDALLHGEELIGDQILEVISSVTSMQRGATR